MAPAKELDVIPLLVCLQALRGTLPLLTVFQSLDDRYGQLGLVC